jgi:uncharacterized repeat protein (TIGR01451 family)
MGIHSRITSRTFPWREALRPAALILGMTAAAVLLVAPKVFAAAPAGTNIGNQASATYTDAGSVSRTVTSNSVVTVVQQVASLTLGSNNTRTGAIGGQMYYPHTLTNTGNGSDSFNLSVGQSGAISLNSVAFYADANGDGIPDNSTAITSTGELAAGGVFKFVVSGTVPSSASSGNTNTLTVTAASAMTPATTAANTDITTVTGNGVIQASESIDLTQGPSSGTRTITMTYTNVGNLTATNVTLTNQIPSGMTYATGNVARWSVSGSTALTDASGGDPAGISYDYNITSLGKVTAVIASVAPGATGTVTFQVSVNAGNPAGANAATAFTNAQFAYNDGAGAIPANAMNALQYTVIAAASLTISDSTVPSGSQGQTVSFTNTVTNTGNATDSFNITLTNSTFPAGTTFQFFKPDGVTPLTSTNADGIPDTGPVAAAGTYNVVVKATLPTNAGTGPYVVRPVATSTADTTKSATGTDTLTAVTQGSVDLTNAGGLGGGVGPEASPVSTATVAPGGTARITLVVANGGAVDDTFNLQASGTTSFSPAALPAGWTVVFRDFTTNAIINSTGVIGASSSKQFYADVTAPAGAAATQQIYFRGVSPTTGATDTLHDAVTIATARTLTITPNQSGQLTAGGTYVYTHTITNTGNVIEGDGGSGSTVTLAATSGAGFTSVIYWDKNNNGVLDSTDPVITDLVNLTGGTAGASTAAGLSVGESATLFVKVTAPASATLGALDTTTITATTSAGAINGTAAPAVASATDASTVISSSITLLKTQAIDVACDGTADTGFSTSTIASGAAPGACLRYQVTATNSGTATVTNVIINDTTPAYTVYDSTVAAATTAGSVTTVPTNGTAGSIKATVGSLAAGGSATLSFGVKITP